MKKNSFLPLFVMMLLLLSINLFDNKMVAQEPTTKQISTTDNSNNPTTTETDEAYAFQNFNNNTMRSYSIILATIIILLIVALVYLYIELRNIKKKLKRRRSSSGSKNYVTKDELKDFKTDIDEKFDAQKKIWIKNAVKELQNELTVQLSDLKGKNKDKNMQEVLFATAVNKENGAFFSVNTIANEETVYRLDMDNPNDKIATFSIEKKAHQWILKCPEYLDYGCELQNMGAAQVVNLTDGVAELKSDGSWHVTKKAKVKFI